MACSRCAPAPAERVGVGINGRRGVTPDTALRLERATGMDAGCWLGLQTRWDLWNVLHSPAAREIEAIERLSALA